MGEEIIILGQLNVTPLFKAQKTFEQAIVQAKSELEIAGAIQMFEIAYELIWKTLKRILAVRGVEVNSPKVTFRQAAKEGLIDNPEIWFEFVKKRNLTTHTYNEDVAQEIFEELPRFRDELAKVIEKIKVL